MPLRPCLRCSEELGAHRLLKHHHRTSYPVPLSHIIDPDPTGRRAADLRAHLSTSSRLPLPCPPSCPPFPSFPQVDLDTIDLSNLNRQFLFRKPDISKPKALVAAATAKQFNPHVHIDARHANIKDKEFDVNWVKTFKLVFGALDNLGQYALSVRERQQETRTSSGGRPDELTRPNPPFTLRHLLTPSRYLPDARRHVNKLCISAGVPLMESGTAGYLGQVRPIVKVSTTRRFANESLC